MAVVFFVCAGDRERSERCLGVALALPTVRPDAVDSEVL
jgi:hypothetical protein